MGEILVLVEHDRGEAEPSAAEALTAARELAAAHSMSPIAVLVGQEAADLQGVCAEYGIPIAFCLTSPLLSDYGPEAWGQAITELAKERSPSIILAVGTDRGNEVLAHIAARMGLPFTANSLQIQRGVTSHRSPR